MITNSLFSLKFIYLIQIINFVWCLETFSNDPDIDRNTTELIVSRGFQSQTFNVTTNDGYILTIFRIINPFIRNRQNLYPVYYQHGAMGNSEQLLITRGGTLFPNGSYIETNGVVNNCSSSDSVAQSLPFILSACGYDVWLGNTRGSKHSTHNRFNHSIDSQFWSFNLDDMSSNDVPAIIQYILSETHSETICYLGYSLGATHMFQLLSTQPQYSRVIRPFIAMAPFIFTGNVRSPIIRLAQVLEPELRSISVRIGGLGKYQPLFGRYFCGNSLLKEICFAIYSVLGGFNIQNFNKEFLPRLWSTFPDALSSIAVAHIGQRIRTNRFNYYDYGEDRNLQVYGQRAVPDYNLSQINSNYIVLMTGRNDYLSDITDNDILRSELTVQPFADYIISNPNWTHGDFLYGNTVGKYINSAVLRVLESLNFNSSLT